MAITLTSRQTFQLQSGICPFRPLLRQLRVAHLVLVDYRSVPRRGLHVREPCAMTLAPDRQNKFHCIGTSLKRCRYTCSRLGKQDITSKRKHMYLGHPMADLVDLLVEIAAVTPLQSAQETPCRNVQHTCDSQPRNKQALPLKSKRGGPVKAKRNQ
jgi:hypothetical protein